MKKIYVTLMCLVIAITAFGKTNNDKSSFFHRQGYMCEVDVHQNLDAHYYSFQYTNASIGIGYREGNGFDTSLVLGYNYDSPLGHSALGYFQLRYHIFNSRISPYVAVGAGIDYHTVGRFSPTVRAAVGVSAGRFSLYFSYVESWINVQVEQANEFVYTRVGTTCPKVGLTFSF